MKKKNILTNFTQNFELTIQCIISLLESINKIETSLVQNTGLNSLTFSMKNCIYSLLKYLIILVNREEECLPPAVAPTNI